METREDIKHRILKHAARLWGYQESEMDVEAFDPVVNLLVEACSTELEKINREVSMADDRIINRVIEMLTPDILTGPQPAHAILHARAVDPVRTSQPQNMFFTQKKIEKTSKDIFFSSVGNYRILDGDVRFIAIGDKVHQLDPALKRSVFFKPKSPKGLPPTVAYIGVDLNAAVSSPEGIPFFFNWRNLTNREYYLHLLIETQWSLNGRKLAVRRGLQSQNTDSGIEVQSPFYKDFKPISRHQERIEKIYQEHFISIEGFADTNGDPPEFQTQKELYPAEFNGAFPAENLIDFKEKLYWIRIEFPAYFPVEVLSKTECFINCFPVMNRRFHKEDNRLQENVNIISLRGEEYFLDIERVYNQQDVSYHAVPLTNIRNYSSGQFTLRKRGIGKYESRDAAQSLMELTDRLRDESSAFAAYNYEYLNTTVRNLNKQINELDQMIVEKNASRAIVPFLVVKPLNPKDVISVEYWSTSGEDANQIPSGTDMEMYAFTGIKREGVQLITGVIGGRDPMSPSESGHVFRMALVNRERIVTREDIKSFCWAELGDRIQRVEVKRGFRTGSLVGEGIERVIQVEIVPVKDRNQAEMEDLVQQLEKSLNRNSTAILPIVITLAANG